MPPAPPQASAVGFASRRARGALITVLLVLRNGWPPLSFGSSPGRAPDISPTSVGNRTALPLRSTSPWALTIEGERHPPPRASPAHIAIFELVQRIKLPHFCRFCSKNTFHPQTHLLRKSDSHTQHEPIPDPSPASTLRMTPQNPLTTSLPYVRHSPASSGNRLPTKSGPKTAACGLRWGW